MRKGILGGTFNPPHVAHLIVAQEVRAAGSAGTVETFNRLLQALAVVELPADFARQDPSETGPQLVERVRVLVDNAL